MLREENSRINLLELCQRDRGIHIAREPVSQLGEHRTLYRGAKQQNPCRLGFALGRVFLGRAVLGWTELLGQELDSSTDARVNARRGVALAPRGAAGAAFRSWPTAWPTLPLHLLSIPGLMLEGRF